MNKLFRDCEGASIIEFTLVMPAFFLIAFGTVDVGFYISDLAAANNAVYVGAHKAILSDPLAAGITNPTYDSTVIGQLCFNPNSGAANSNCTSALVSVTCTPAAAVGNGTCVPNTYTYSDTSFANVIFPAMQRRLPKLQRQNVKITYVTNNLGFVGRPGGLPMSVSVSITGVDHHFYFLSGLMGAFGSGFLSSVSLPSFSTTMPSEDLTTN